MKFQLLNLRRIKGKLMASFGVVLFLSLILAIWGYVSINNVIALKESKENVSKINFLISEIKKKKELPPPLLGY